MPLGRSVLVYPVLLFVLPALGCSKSESAGPAGGLQGTAIDTYVTEGGQPTMLAQPKTTYTSISAQVTSNGATTSYDGTLDDKGQILIPNVPEGTYLLEVDFPPPAKVPAAGDTPNYIEMSGREFELGYTRSHRSGLEPLQTASTISLSAPLTVPWTARTMDATGTITQPLDDVLRIFSRSTSALGSTYAGSQETGAPKNQATALAGWQIDLSSDSYSYDLPTSSEYSAAASDDLVLLHNVTVQVDDSTLSATDPWAWYSFESTQEALFAKPFDLKSGGTATIDGSFQATTQKTLDLDFRGSEITSLLTDAPKIVADRTQYSFDIYLEPGTPHPMVGADATLFELTANALGTYTNNACAGSFCDPTACPSGCDLGTATLPGDYKHSFSYGNPFDYGQELFAVYIGFAVTVTPLLADTTTESVAGFLSYEFPIADVSGKPLEPFLGLPRGLTLNGKTLPTNVVTEGIGTTPTIAFQAPTLGTPDYYLAFVYQLDDQTDINGNAVLNEIVGSYRTTKTSFTLPEGMLKSGKHYYVRLVAHQEDNYSAESPYGAPAAHAAEAATFTGVFTP